MADKDDIMNVKGIFEFAVGQNILAYFEGLLYPAKCMNRRVTKAGGVEYYVHYTGFKTKWDEWALEDEVLEVNSINLDHKKRLEDNRNKTLKALKRGKKSQDPWTTESSSEEDEKPAPKKRGRPRKNVKQAAKLVVKDKPISIVQKDAAPVEEDKVKLIAEDNAIPVVQGDLLVPVEEDKAAVQAVANIELKIIPCSKVLADKLTLLGIPKVLREAISLDHSMHESFNMLLIFSEENFVAEVLHAFTKSSYFLGVNSQMKYSTVFPVTLLKYFNASIFKHLTYRNEILNSVRNKGMAFFQQRMKDQPNINFMFKDQLDPKRIWCYLYGPMYLLRLIDNLPKILSLNSWHPEYDSDIFVLHIRQLMRFLVNNFKTYFRINDYIAAEDYPFTL